MATGLNAAAAPRSSARGVMLGLAAVMVDGFDLQNIGYLAPEIARDWSLPIAAFAPVFAAGLAGTIPGAIAAGPVAHRIGRRAVLALSLLLFGLATLAAPAAHSVTTLVVLRILAGLGLGAAIPAAMTLVATGAPVRRQATLTTLVLCGQPVGSMVGAALCARLVPLYGWRSAFLAGGVLPLMMALLVRRSFAPDGDPSGAPRPDRDASKRSVLRQLFEPPRASTTMLLTASACLGSVMLYIVVNWLPGVLRDSGYSARDVMQTMALFNLGGIVGGLVIGRVIDQRGPLGVVPAVFLAAAASLVALALGRASALGLAASVIACGLAAYGAGVSMGPTTLLLHPEALRTAGTGWVLGISRLGAAASPFLVSAILLAGLPAGHIFYMAAGAALSAAALMRLLFRLHSARD